MSLSNEIEKLKYDKRLQTWYLNRKMMTREELEQHLNSLPDLATNVEPFVLSGEDKSSDSDLQD
jgi:hypothetical protein